MEIFGFLVPMWAMFLSIYVIGMPLIGYPVGKFSLKAWKYPEEYPLIGKILFPINGFVWSTKNGSTIGEYHYDGEGGNNLPSTMFLFDVHNGLKSNAPLPLAEYLVMQMLIWPLRLTYLPIALGIIVAFKIVTNFPTFAGKQLMRCKHCLEI